MTYKRVTEGAYGCEEVEKIVMFGDRLIFQITVANPGEEPGRPVPPLSKALDDRPSYLKVWIRH